MKICGPTSFRGLAFSGKAVKLVEMLVSHRKKAHCEESITMMPSC